LNKSIPSRCKTLEIVSRAITVDNDGNYDKACPFTATPSAGSPGLKCEKNECSKKWLIIERVEGYMKRAEVDTPSSKGHSRVVTD
jgi:hypothetical protein